jgi:formimidoylglutamate deiminase
VDAADELRMLEYSQRLVTHRRNVGASASEPDVATALTLGAVAGGAAASGRPVGGLAVGQRADFVVLDAGHPAIAGLSAPDALAVSIFASGRRQLVGRVVVAGRTVVDGGRHPLRTDAAEAFIRARTRLASRSASDA